ncbi:MAG: polysaccharide deacetylase family protein, partial [Bdellovibrionales bacterium]|nr:polysaccharide deacetylase family protein [Bdellovibrionales bacterium]
EVRSFYQFPEEGREYIPVQDRGFSKYYARSLYGSRKVALTFDDGPHPTRTAKLLDILADYDVKATFFVLAEKINARTLPIVQRILEEGHHLASHDWDHDNNNVESENKHFAELLRSVQAIEQVERELGVEQRELYYRYPYGAYGRNKDYHHLNVMKDVSDKIYGENCINFVFWDIDTSDWLSKMTAQNIADNIVANIDGGVAYRHKRVRGKFVKDEYRIDSPIGGGVVLMHDIHRRSVEATQIFLEYAANSDVEIVPLSDVQEYSFTGHECRVKTDG